MYEIHLTCFDPPYDKPPYGDKVEKEFQTAKEAKMALLECLLQEVESLNMPDVDFTPRTNIFVPGMSYSYEGKKYDGAIIMWDGDAGIQEQPVTLYEVCWVNRSTVDPYNQKLKERYGKSITLAIHSEEVEDEDADCDNDGNYPLIEKFYYEGVTCGRSELFDTVEEAYEEARDYMENIDLYVD